MRRIEDSIALCRGGFDWEMRQPSRRPFEPKSLNSRDHQNCVEGGEIRPTWTLRRCSGYELDHSLLRAADQSRGLKRILALADLSNRIESGGAASQVQRTHHRS